MGTLDMTSLAWQSCQPFSMNFCDLVTDLLGDSHRMARRANVENVENRIKESKSMPQATKPHIERKRDFSTRAPSAEPYVQVSKHTALCEK